VAVVQVETTEHHLVVVQEQSTQEVVVVARMTEGHLLTLGAAMQMAAQVVQA
jgi:hypothetical protein